MDKAKDIRKISCSLSQHEDEYISMIDSNPESKKSLYCCLCLVEQSAQSGLPKTLKTVKEFIRSTSEAFEIARNQAQSRGEPPPNFSDQISRKGEYLEKLTNSLNQQKAQLKSTFDKLRDSILKLIDEKEKKYEEAISDQLKAACDLYGEFERILAGGWPKASDFDQLFPLYDEVEHRFRKAADALQLEALVENLKGDIKADQMFAGEKGQAKRVTHLESLMKTFKDIEARPPNIDLTNLDVGKLESPLRELIDQMLAKKAYILNSISTNQCGLSKSDLLKTKDLNLLRSWLPEKYKLNLELLYKSSIDGKGAADFHRKCDNKGPTITFVKCRFNGANKWNIIGGFTDQNWLSNSSYQTSLESFVFSLTSQVKCPIITNTNAIYGRADYGPTFGGGHDIYITNNFGKSSYSNPHSYYNTKAILDYPGYQGGSLTFEPEEIEVFSLN